MRKGAPGATFYRDSGVQGREIVGAVVTCRHGGDVNTDQSELRVI